MNIDHMTEEWVDAGQHSGQDILDLVKEVKKWRRKAAKLEGDAAIYRQRIEALQKDSDFWQEEACKAGIAMEGTADASYTEQLADARKRMGLPTMADARDGARHSTRR